MTELIAAKLFATQVFFNQFIIVFDRCLKQLLTQLLNLLFKGLWNLTFCDLRAHFIFVNDRFSLYDIHYSCKQLSLTQRVLHRMGIRTKSLSHHLHNIPKISADTVHFIHQGNPWYRVSVCLTPYSFRLRLNTTYSAENSNSTI